MTQQEPRTQQIAADLRNRSPTALSVLAPYYPPSQN
jgi:hypothetical protein